MISWRVPNIIPLGLKPPVGPSRLLGWVAHSMNHGIPRGISRGLSYGRTAEYPLVGPVEYAMGVATVRPPPQLPRFMYHERAHEINHGITAYTIHHAMIFMGHSMEYPTGQILLWCVLDLHAFLSRIAQYHVTSHGTPPWCYPWSIPWAIRHTHGVSHDG